MFFASLVHSVLPISDDDILSEHLHWDACIIGSGAGGGIVAHALTRAGANVVMLEAGEPWSDATDSAMLRPAFSSPRRGRPTARRAMGEFDAFVGGRDLPGEPYTYDQSAPFDWVRARMVGGRTNVWGRISLRFGPDDFRGYSIDTLGRDWPIGYDDLAPYYDALDQFIGVSGSSEGLFNEPDGIFLPAFARGPAAALVQSACNRLGLRCIPARLSVLSRAHGARPACIGCGHCNRGCHIGACFSSPTVLLEPALASGRLKLVTGAMASRIEVDATGRATAVIYVDRLTGAHRRVTAEAVVVAAGACESARLLFNSASPLFPHGLGNDGGHLGRWLTDTTTTEVEAFVPDLPPRLDRCAGPFGDDAYIPWQASAAQTFPRGYHIEVRRDDGAPIAGSMRQAERFPGGGGFGINLKSAYRDRFGRVLRLAGRGEMIPNLESFCTIDPTVVDRWGIPVLRFHWAWGDAERLQVVHMRERLCALVDAAGGAMLSGGPRGDDHGMPRPGSMSHEVGCTRMGASMDDSVVDSQCRVHGLRNVVVADGGPFVSHPNKNPTWTIMALAWRTADGLLDGSRGSEV